MSIDIERLEAFVLTLSDDQKQMIRDSLGGVDAIDPGELARILSTRESTGALERLAVRTANGGVSDAGTSNGGTGSVMLEPPLTRW